jgi:hypothetical protein
MILNLGRQEVLETVMAVVERVIRAIYPSAGDQLNVWMGPKMVVTVHHHPRLHMAHLMEAHRRHHRLPGIPDQVWDLVKDGAAYGFVVVEVWTSRAAGFVTRCVLHPAAFENHLV